MSEIVPSPPDRGGITLRRVSRSPATTTLLLIAAVALALLWRTTEDARFQLLGNLDDNQSMLDELRKESGRERNQKIGEQLKKAWQTPGHKLKDFALRRARCEISVQRIGNNQEDAGSHCVNKMPLDKVNSLNSWKRSWLIEAETRLETSLNAELTMRLDWQTVAQCHGSNVMQRWMTFLSLTETLDRNSVHTLRNATSAELNRGTDNRT